MSGPDMLRNRSEIEQAIVKRAWINPEFKKKLLSDPAAAIAEELGTGGLPADVKVTVLEEDDNTLYLVLPRPPSSPEELEITEESLQSVAGGVGTPCVDISAFTTPCVDISTQRDKLSSSFIYSLRNFVRTSG